MELAKQKFEKIRDAWNYYFLEYSFCQNEINYTDEVQTNYFGDVAAYFDDTFPLISKEPFTNSRQEHLGNAMALLQAIFVQQDLMDEIMYIFKLGKSSDDFKKVNRDLRNELIGHPIRRDLKTKKLVSTVFLRYDNPANEIIYVLYEMKDRFKGKMQTRSISKIISDHTKFLNRNFDIILKKIKEILYKQRRELETLLQNAENIKKTPSVIEDTFKYFEAIADHGYTYKKDRLLEYWGRRKEHPRYAYAIKQFREELKVHLKEKIEDIFTYGKQVKVPPPFDPASIPKINITFGAAEPIKGQRRKYKKDMGYEFSKLSQKDHPLGLSYLLERFGERKFVGDELRHMRNNIHNDTEYYAGYYYVKKLLKGTGSKMFYA